MIAMDEDNVEIIRTSDSTTGTLHPQGMRNMIMTPTPHHKQINPEITKLKVVCGHSTHRPQPRRMSNCLLMNHDNQKGREDVLHI